MGLPFLGFHRAGLNRSGKTVHVKINGHIFSFKFRSDLIEGEENSAMTKGETWKTPQYGLLMRRDSFPQE